MNIIKNTRYYKWIENDVLEEVRITKIQNESTVGVLVTKGPNSGEYRKIDFSILTDDYIRLIPDGYITFSIVTLSKYLKDVVVVVNRNEDTQKGDGIPYCVCRQCVLDLFAKQLSPDNVDYVGISISKDTCPADIDFSNYLACESVEKSEVVAYYIGDKLDIILSILSYAKTYNSILTDLHDSHCKYLSEKDRFLYEIKKHDEIIDGYCKDIKTLLSINNFEYDLQTAFNIIPLDILFDTGDGYGIAVIDPANGNYTLTEKAREVLSNILLMSIDKSIIVQYEKDIDLSAIKRRYCLISDFNKNVYVVAYTISGKYHPDINKVESEDNIEKIANYIPSESIRNAMSMIMFNSKKYKK